MAETFTDSTTPVEHQVLGIVGTLVAELGGQPTRAPSLHDSLDRDLGISSLERVELLLRLERAFGVRLPDSVMAEAATPQELAAAIISAAPASAESVPARFEPTTPGTPAPASARTLTDVLRWHAGRTPDRHHIYLRRDDGTERRITYDELLAGSNAVASGLGSVGVRPGDRVALILRTEQGFFETFFGALLCGAVPVPLYPPFRADELLDYTQRQRAILRNAGPRVLVTFAEAERLAALIRPEAPSLETIATVERLAAGRTYSVDASSGADDPALIQYTSGSTGDPKGVLLTHRNLLANIRAIGEALDVRSSDVCVSWLPLYHDMGLIGAWLGALYYGVPIALMSPLAFLSRPARWLQTIHAHRGTISPAPNFAFDLSVRKIADDELKGLDLSSWRLALNGSEVVSPETIDRFTRRFGPYGFGPEAMCPVYGLAESSVGLTASPLGRVPRVDHIARAPFEQSRELQPAGPAESRPLQFVSCGRPLPGHEVRIADASGRALEERMEGHVHFRGPSVTSGYFRNAEATRAVLSDGWMDSGDLGYWADGELFITGREKDLIIQAGRNIYAQEVEDLVAMVPGVRKGRIAAFGVHDPARGTERLVVVAETKERDAARRQALRQALVDRLVAGIGVPPDVVVIADPGAVLKTPSGKIRRSATREAYLNNTLGRKSSVSRQWARLVLAAFGAGTKRLARHTGRFVYTGYVLAVLSVTLPTLWVNLLLSSEGRRSNRAAKRWSRLMLGMCGIRMRVEGLEHLDGIRSGILVANHASYIDPIVLMRAIPSDFHFVAKQRLATYPLIGTVIRKAGHSTIEKARVAQQLAGAEDIARLLGDDELLVIFPEGTFTRAPGLLPFRLGAFKAAVLTGRPIIPVAIRGTRDVLPADTWLARRRPVVVTVGAPLRPAAEGWPEMVRLRDLARAEIARTSSNS